MDDFSITRPEGVTPASNSGGGSRNDTRQQRRPKPEPEPVAPKLPDASEESDSHQVDELA